MNKHADTPHGTPLVPVIFTGTGPLQQRLLAMLRLVAINALVLLALAGLLEAAARLAFPEFTGHIHSESRTLDKAVHFGEFHGVMVRIPHPGARIDASRPLMVVLGDSISNGYGMAYEDVYWEQLRRMQDGGEPLQVAALAGYGNNLADSAALLQRLAADQVPVKRVLYQFNFNDITPFGHARLQQAAEPGSLARDFGRWRYEYANRSTFLRVVQHHAGTLTRRLQGSCEARGLDALGAYTWSYGSRPYREESEREWRRFEAELAQLQATTRQMGAALSVLVSPLVFDVDPQGRHPHFNHLQLDFGCATIDPRSRLAAAGARLGIAILDPAPLLRTAFENRIREGNPEPFFFTADENHFTPVTAHYIAEYLHVKMFHPAATPHDREAGARHQRVPAAANAWPARQPPA